MVSAGLIITYFPHLITISFISSPYCAVVSAAEAPQRKGRPPHVPLPCHICAHSCSAAPQATVAARREAVTSASIAVPVLPHRVPAVSAICGHWVLRYEVVLAISGCAADAHPAHHLDPSLVMDVTECTDNNGEHSFWLVDRACFPLLRVITRFCQLASLP